MVVRGRKLFCGMREYVWHEAEVQEIVQVANVAAVEERLKGFVGVVLAEVVEGTCIIP